MSLKEVGMIREFAVKVRKTRPHLLAVACLALLFLLFGAFSYSTAEQQPDMTSPSQLSVMTRNIYFGTDPTMVSIPRQWAAVDVEVGRQTVRVITTHLEAALLSIRVEQVQELLAGPAATELPAILVGDFNAETEVEGDAAALITAEAYLPLMVQPTAP